HNGRNILLKKYFGYFARMFRIVILLLESPLFTKHLVSFRKVFFYNINIKLSSHVFTKTKETSFSFNTKTAPGINLVRSLELAEYLYASTLLRSETIKM